MSSRYAENADLTTDALPSPPRERNENTAKNSSDDSDNKESRFEEINSNSSRAYSRRTKTRGFTKVKKISPPTAYASIININNSSHVHVGTNITNNINMPEKSDTRQDKPEIIETNAIKTLRINPNPITIEDMQFVSEHLGEGWQEVGRALNYSDGQIKQFYLNHNSYGIKEVIYQLLLDWYRNDPSKATVGNLSNILWEQNERDIVRRWSERTKA